MKRWRWTLVIIIVASACVTRQEDLSGLSAWARPAAARGEGGATITAVYLTLENRGDTAEQLVVVSSEVADSAELHQTLTSEGLTRMQRVDHIEIPASSAVKFRPGGYHIMLSNFKRDLEPGQTFLVALQFASAKTLMIEVSVQEDPP